MLGFSPESLASSIPSLIHVSTALSDSVREVYIEELREKITTGRQRVKKRNRTIEKTTSLNISNKYKGTFISLEVYKKDRQLHVGLDG